MADRIYIPEPGDRVVFSPTPMALAKLPPDAQRRLVVGQAYVVETVVDCRWVKLVGFGDLVSPSIHRAFLRPVD